MSEPTETLRKEIDLLVGGDLSKEETRTLVEQLDASPDGWKRCGLAFIESQLWKRAMHSLIPEEAESTPEPAVLPSPKRRSRLVVATVAACAFAIGVGITLAWTVYKSPQSGGENIAEDRPADNSPIEKQRKKSADGKQQQRVVGLIRVSTDGITETAFSLVNTAEQELAPVQLASKSPTEYDRELWNRRGFHVEQHRKIVSVELADGNRFQFPVEWNNYRYVGQPVY